MIQRHWLNLVLLFATCFLLFTSCSKDTFITGSDAELSNSTYKDSIRFDTVFTTVGSITQSFKIFNNNDQKLLLSELKLMGGNSSSFQLNINGLPANEADNIEIAANDSIYVFVTVNIDPTADDLPFIVKDSILINYNGNNKYIQLEAYGQNAHFIHGLIIQNDTIWTNDLPYVILDSVRVNSSATLTIQEGCRIYSHATAPFLIDGTLIATGTKDKNIIFSGDRLDFDYKDLPASWPGIVFRAGSNNNVLTHVVVKNADKAITVNNAAKLTLHRCIIDNAADAGIYCYNTSLDVDNTLISNCGKNIDINYGGTYNFTNCTIATYGNNYITHKDPVVQANNYDASSGTTLSNTLTANFTNCIIWGSNGNVDDEAVISKQGTNTVTVNFTNTLYRSMNSLSNVNFIGTSFQNIDPAFDSIVVDRRIFNFHTTKNSPGIDQGTNTSFDKDLDDNPRTTNTKTDMGCYEKQ